MNKILPPQYFYAGVYMIENITNKKVYIGSSYNIEARINSHRSALRNGTHHCKELQEDFNKHHTLRAHVLYVEPILRKDRRKNRNRFYAIEWKFIEKYDAINKGYNRMHMSDIVRNTAI